jgi:undecaprenyl-diphosphatase
MTDTSAGRVRAGVAAVVCLLAMLLLGQYMHNWVSPFDVKFEAEAFGGMVPMAMYLSELGFLGPLLRLGAVLLFIGIVSQKYRPQIFFSLGTLVSAHLASDFLKNVFQRARPEHWILIHETSYSYPSGHAATATAFYGLWAYWILRETKMTPRIRAILGFGVGTVAYGICWSRLVLGAHWPTDVIGGVLLGLSVVYLAHALFGDPAPPVGDEDEYEYIDIEELEEELHTQGGRGSIRRR